MEVFDDKWVSVKIIDGQKKMVVSEVWSESQKEILGVEKAEQ
jgi:hypothetical protein